MSHFQGSSHTSWGESPSIQTSPCILHPGPDDHCFGVYVESPLKVNPSLYHRWWPLRYKLGGGASWLRIQLKSLGSLINGSHSWVPEAVATGLSSKSFLLSLTAFPRTHSGLLHAGKPDHPPATLFRIQH